MKTEICHQQEKSVAHPATGKHLLLTLRGCDLSVLNEDEQLRTLVKSAALATRATVLQLVSQRFEPNGITVIAVLAESHATLHTYPEEGVVFWDCFTCGETCDPELSTAVLLAKLRPTNVEANLVAR